MVAKYTICDQRLIYTVKTLSITKLNYYQSIHLPSTEKNERRTPIIGQQIDSSMFLFNIHTYDMMIQFGLSIFLIDRNYMLLNPFDAYGALFVVLHGN